MRVMKSPDFESTLKDSIEKAFMALQSILPPDRAPNRDKIELAFRRCFESLVANSDCSESSSCYVTARRITKECTQRGVEVGLMAMSIDVGIFVSVIVDEEKMKAATVSDVENKAVQG